MRVGKEVLSNTPTPKEMDWDYWWLDSFKPIYNWLYQMELGMFKTASPVYQEL